MKLIVSVLGGGKIGAAVAKGIAKSDKVSKVIITKRDISTIKSLATTKVRITTDNRAAVRQADAVLIAVKPGDAKHVTSEIEGLTSGKLVISLMAAVPLKKLEAALPNTKIVRAMPNIAAIVGESITAYAGGSNVTPMDLETAKMIFNCFGDSVEIPESLMDAVTGLSGSGPAYIAILIDAMVTAGLKVGIPRDIAMKLATKTLTGTANLLNQNKLHPSELRDTVTTPSGTTIAGVYELEKGSFRISIINAVEAATMAAERVAKKFETEN